jgi:ribosome-binding factor A
METQRQKKIAGLLQQDLAEIMQRAAAGGGLKGVIITVSKVYVAPDLSVARVYVSIFPSKEAEPLLRGIKEQQPQIRHELARRTRHQLRRVPELLFFLDDSLDYIEGIEKSLEAGEDPIENPDLLDRRKKS